MWVLPISGASGSAVLPVFNVTTPAGDIAAVASAASRNASVEELMALYVEGDQAAFEHLYHELSPRLFGYLLRLTRQREQAEDLVQITFTKIHRARDSYLLGAPLLPWVLAIARRSFFDACRRARVRPEYLSKDGLLPESSTPEESLGNDVTQALEQALNNLPHSYAEAIQLTKITGLSVSEAAEVLKTSKMAVKLRVHRGYKILRKVLEQYGRVLHEEGVERS